MLCTSGGCVRGRSFAQGCRSPRRAEAAAGVRQCPRSPEDSGGGNAGRECRLTAWVGQGRVPVGTREEFGTRVRSASRSLAVQINKEMKIFVCFILLG